MRTSNRKEFKIVHRAVQKNWRDSSLYQISHYWR